MFLLYSLLAFMLIVALILLSIPFAKKQRKGFLIIAVFTILTSSVVYYFTGNYQAIQQWLTQGKQHYQLQVEVSKMGGIDGIIGRVKEKLKTNPSDAQGWLILGKLYEMKQNYPAAKDALDKAQRLKPDSK